MIVKGIADIESENKKQDNLGPNFVMAETKKEILVFMSFDRLIKTIFYEAMKVQKSF